MNYTGVYVLSSMRMGVLKRPPILCGRPTGALLDRRKGDFEGRVGDPGSGQGVGRGTGGGEGCRPRDRVRLVYLFPNEASGD